MLTIEKHGRVAVLTLDDGKANVVSEAFSQAINEGLDAAERDADAVLLVGRPGRFSAGFDLNVIREGKPERAAATPRRRREARRSAREEKSARSATVPGVDEALARVELMRKVAKAVEGEHAHKPQSAIFEPQSRATADCMPRESPPASCPASRALVARAGVK